MSDDKDDSDFCVVLNAARRIRYVADVMKARHPNRAAKIEENAAAAMAAVWRMLEESK